MITTQGGTTFSVAGESVVITRSDQPEATIPVADIREFADSFRAVKSYPHPGFEPVKYAGDELLQHHPDVKPWTLRTMNNAVLPFVVQCPECGFRAWGGTLEMAARSWNRHIRMSNPHADSAS